jgi:hypothetical protein
VKNDEEDDEQGRVEEGVNGVFFQNFTRGNKK